MINMTPLLAFIEGIGGPELMMILFIILLLFGANRLPELARGLGKSMREFKKAASNVEDEFRRAMEDDERKELARKRPQGTFPRAEDNSALESPPIATPSTVAPSAVAPSPAAPPPDANTDAGPNPPPHSPPSETSGEPTK